MEAYIDLSYIFHLMLCISSTKLLKIIVNITMSKRKLFLLEITGVVLYLNVLLFKDYIYLNLIYYVLIFFFLFKKDMFIPLITYIFSYYSQIAIIRIFTNSIYLYKGIVMIYKPKGILFIIIIPLLFLIIEIITRSIKSIILLKKYRYKVKVNIKNKIYDTSAYFDSGNTMKFKNLPVVFLTRELKDKNISYEKLLIEGIGKETGEYLKGKIYFKNKEKDVYFAYVNKKSFNGCKCLLNVYLLS